LNPLQEKIKGFEDKVEKTHKESIDYHAALRQQIIGLKELNQQMSKETLNLTKALKGENKVQGDWGETQLEILLEKANLIKEIHYSTQGGYRDDQGKLKKPDFIINLPNNRHLIVDSKVSLTAYERYYSAENEEDKVTYLKSHIDSIRKHFRELSDKKYEQLYDINSPDYVLMFVPVEPAYLLALSNNDGLYLEALDRNIVLVSTSTLLATLSTISSMWRQENQKKNVIEIAKQAGALYDQFVNLTEDLVKVGNQLKTVQGTYDVSMKKLTGKGNLIRRVENIRALGASTSKNLNQTLLDRALEND
jgi:DNA recombination protein RmuC